ncbi:hypothetical protein SESBI_31896 [Sesbania bispinosa]|nr:hypothetical protein SESBI_31896 [Sesbania bispinosa]
MDVGCIISASQSPDHSPDGDAHPPFFILQPLPSVSIPRLERQNKLTKEASQSTSSALYKFKSQIRKPPRRKTSPVNWFPRKKVDSYLKRKIKMLQEIDGMNLTLDQTLGSSNPHYSRVLREKMAAREAAHKAMEARRAALVEASWCRILRAARIPSDDAEAQLLKAEKSAIEAFEAAQAMGVIMFDLPDCPRKHCQIETSSVNGEGSSTHTVTASFETAFEVDKEVAAAVKAAFIRLAHCPSFSKDEVRELLRKLVKTQIQMKVIRTCLSSHQSMNQSLGQSLIQPLKRMTSTPRLGFQNAISGVKMFARRRTSSLATIVATYGLNAALGEMQNIKQHNPASASEYASSSAINFQARRMSSLGLRKKQDEPEWPSLDKFLVKHMTKLEREVWEAKKNRRNETESEKDIKEAKIKSGKEAPRVPSGMPSRQKDHTEVHTKLR